MLLLLLLRKFRNHSCAKYIYRYGDDVYLYTIHLSTSYYSLISITKKRSFLWKAALDLISFVYTQLDFSIIKMLKKLTISTAIDHNYLVAQDHK